MKRNRTQETENNNDKKEIKSFKKLRAITIPCIKKKCTLITSYFDYECIVCNKSFCDRHCIRNCIGILCYNCLKDYMNHCLDIRIKNDSIHKGFDSSSRELLMVYDKEKKRIVFEKNI